MVRHYGAGSFVITQRVLLFFVGPALSAYGILDFFPVENKKWWFEKSGRIAWIVTLVVIEVGLCLTATDQKQSSSEKAVAQAKKKN